MATAPFQAARQRRQLVAVQQGAGGVGRRGDQGANAVAIPVPLDQLRVQLVAALRADRHQLRGALDQAQEVAVARVAGIGQQPVLAGVDQQAGGEQQGTGAARGDQDALGVERHAVALGIEAGQRLAQLRNATRRGVTGVSGGQRGLPGGDDRRGGAEVRLADLQVDHIMAGGLQLVGAGQQGHDVEGFDGAAARTEGLGHWPSFIE